MYVLVCYMYACIYMEFQLHRISISLSFYNLFMKVINIYAHTHTHVHIWDLINTLLHLDDDKSKFSFLYYSKGY